MPEEIQSSFRKLLVWQKAVVLTTEIYKLTRTFPPDERYALSLQMQRAAVSIPSNIAEGSGRNGPKEFVQFIAIALGSACELETQLEVAHALGYSKTETHSELISTVIEIKKMLVSLRSSILRP